MPPGPGGFVDPIHVTSPKDGTGRLFVCERPGIIRIIDKNGKVLDEPFYNNQANTLFQFLEVGLYCIEFHPKFKENGLFYVSYADMWFNGSTFIVEYKVDASDPNKADMASRRAALQTLIESRPPDLQSICERLLSVRFLNTTAVRGLALFDDPEIGHAATDGVENQTVDNEDRLRAADPDIVVEVATTIKPALGGVGISALVRNHGEKKETPGKCQGKERAEGEPEEGCRWQ